MWKRHADQIVTHFSATFSPDSRTPDDVESFTDETTSTEEESPIQTDEPLMTPKVPEQTSVEQSGETGNRYPVRNRTAPDRYIPTVN